MHSPFLGNPELAVEEDVLSRKARRVVLSWLEGTCTPGEEGLSLRPAL